MYQKRPARRWSSSSANPKTPSAVITTAVHWLRLDAWVVVVLGGVVVVVVIVGVIIVVEVLALLLVGTAGPGRGECDWVGDAAGF